ncbi:MAG: dienelactone hydrolase family protein [Candidatus Rokubacteria bacterium]|nr:dienelactone hydrolase family protein [Candidatus Rokubacteria bacterium]
MANPLSRREVLKFGAYTTVGGVLTPGVSLAQAIVTDTKGITARDIQLSVGGAMIPGYDARPEAVGRYPVVLAISGFTGLSEHHKDVVRRFAHAGFYAIAPELYHREGGMQGKDFQAMGRIAGGVTRAQYLGDIRAAADYAKGQPWARADRIGVTGFCGGGALTLHFTAESPDVTAAVPWYGHLKRTYSDAPGVDAFSLMDRIKVPVLGLYGDADSGIASDDVKRFETELRKRNPSVEFMLYAGAPHAFFSDDRPQVYRKDAAEDAWRRCVAFFTKHLKA